VNTTKSNLFSPEACRQALMRAWQDNLTQRDHIIVALPLTDPEGWQIVLEVKQITATKALLSDRGETISRLACSGLDVATGPVGELLDQKIRSFEYVKKGSEILKEISLPFDGLDIQLFGEGLVSISHLTFRHELASAPVTHVYSGIREILVKQGLRFQEQEKATIPGRTEKTIRVDFLIEEKSLIACQTVGRKGRMRPYMEQWGYRWIDAKTENTKLIRGMFYDPDNQLWDEESKRIGESHCEIFLPYFEIDKITAALNQYKEAA
jgi:hypothetical protein